VSHISRKNERYLGHPSSSFWDRFGPDLQLCARCVLSSEGAHLNPFIALALPAQTWAPVQEDDLDVEICGQEICGQTEMTLSLEWFCAGPQFLGVSVRFTNPHLKALCSPS
jgi:hypothetical protein